MKKYYLHRTSQPLKADYERDLNPEQYAAVMHPSGPALVLAGAGTGKTRVVTYRVARLIETGASPEDILLLTFTNKAAKEMMRRAEQLIGRNIMGLYGGTFHHIANLFLRQHYRLAGYRQGFSILDREDAKELFEACIPEAYGKESVVPRGSVLLEITGLSKNTGVGIGGTLMRRFPHLENSAELIEKVSALYEKKKLLLNLMDFDDLLLNWKKILEENEDIREYYSLKFRHILVDEYQDTNVLQAGTVDLISAGAGNLMVVGDDAQSIYSFRGANFENILKFPEKYPGVAIFRLTTNYRSTPEILHLANTVISVNTRQFQKDLRADLPSGELPNVVPLKDIFEEAEFVSSVMTEMNSDGRSFNDIAVLYRSHYQSMQLQMELQRRGIPFEIRSGLKFFEQAHIKDMISYLKIIANPDDEISWKRVLKLIRGIGNMTAGKVWKHISASSNPFVAISGSHGLIPRKSMEGFNTFLALLDKLRQEELRERPAEAIGQILSGGYEGHLFANYTNAEMRLEDIEQMRRFAARYDSLDIFLSDLTLQGVSETEGEDIEREDGKVVLSSVHQAKGLEWAVVFLIGLNDGRFPSKKSLRSREDEEEERRLFYVAVTRARELLYLCYPVASEDWHAMGFLRPSRFIKELPRECFEEVSVEGV